MFQVGFHLVRGAGSQCCLGAGASRPRPSPRPCLGKRKLLQVVGLKGWFALTFPALENVAKRLEQPWRCLFLFFLFFFFGGGGTLQTCSSTKSEQLANRTTGPVGAQARAQSSQPQPRKARRGALGPEPHRWYRGCIQHVLKPETIEA